MKKGKEGWYRIGSIIFLAALWFTCLRGASVQAKSTYFKEPYRIEQISVNAPDVTLYMTGNSVSEEDEFSAQIKGNEGTMDLRQESCSQFSETGEGISYVILLDNSGSVSQSQFDQTKKELIGLRKQIGKNDRMTLYTVGSNKKTGNYTVVLKNSGKKGAAADIRKIQKIERNQQQTVLYRTITKELNRLNNNKQRTIMLLITDGEDDSQGLYNKSYEVNDAVKNAQIPVYGILLKNELQNSAPNQAKINNTRDMILGDKLDKRCSGYCGVTCKSAGDVKREFQKIDDILKKQTYVVGFRADNNRENANAKLSVTTPGGKTLTKQMEYNSHVPDNDKPVISEITEVDADTIQLKITDASSNVAGALEAANYIVKRKGSKEGEEVWNVKKVTSEGDNIYQLHFTEKLINGKYLLSCQNITDDSQEAADNVITDTYEFQVAQGLNAQVEALKGFLKSFWWVFLLLLVAVLGIIVVRVIKNRQVIVEKKPADDLLAAEAKKIHLTVTDRNGQVNELEWDVKGSIFIGRSNICNIYFEDDLLSKQHFAIEITKMADYIEDLETTNGTFVNGVRIAGKRALLDGDIITAGREKIVFHTVQRDDTDKN